MSCSPVAVREAEISHPLAGITASPEYGSAAVLVRWYSEPLALAEIPLADGRASAVQVARSLWQSVEPVAASRLGAAGAEGPCLDHPSGHTQQTRPGPDFPAELLTRGLRLSWPPGYLLGRAAVLHNAPPASVIVCASHRGAELERCLTAVLGQDYPDFEVIVVDNAAADSTAAELVAQRNAAGTRGVPLRRVAGPRRGLACARNAGLAAASGTIVAYLDDDGSPDRHWLAELARGFTVRPRVAGVSGLMLAAALDTPAQGRHERFTPRVFDLPPAFGDGGSMAFTRAALTRVGGLDAGPFVYWPGAVMWPQQGRLRPSGS
jgi:O-antigen biosynthesis protein